MQHKNVLLAKSSVMDVFSCGVFLASSLSREMTLWAIAFLWTALFLNVLPVFPWTRLQIMIWAANGAQWAVHIDMAKDISQVGWNYAEICPMTSAWNKEGLGNVFMCVQEGNGETVSSGKYTHTSLKSHRSLSSLCKDPGRPCPLQIV